MIAETEKLNPGRIGLKAENGVVLIVVLVLSAVALALMTALIYMITTATQVSGLQKNYQTASEAAEGGEDVLYQLLTLRAETASTNAFIANLNTFNLASAVTTSNSCTGSIGSTPYSAFAAKIMAPSTSWSGCSNSLAIDPADPASYDFKMRLGTTVKYDVYAKIVSTTDGNSGGGEGLQTQGVVSANSGEVAVSPMPYLYAIEILSENSTRKSERAKVSVLYQY